MKAVTIAVVAALGMAFLGASPVVEGAWAGPGTQGAMLDALDAKNGYLRWKLGSAIPAALRKSLTKGGDGTAWAEVGTIPLGGDELGAVSLTYFKGQLMRIEIACDTEDGWDRLTRGLWEAYGFTPGAFLAAQRVQLRESAAQTIAIESISLMAQKRLADIAAEEKRSRGAAAPL